MPYQSQRLNFPISINVNSVNNALKEYSSIFTPGENMTSFAMLSMDGAEFAVTVQSSLKIDVSIHDFVLEFLAIQTGLPED